MPATHVLLNRNASFDWWLAACQLDRCQQKHGTASEESVEVTVMDHRKGGGGRGGGGGGVGGGSNNQKRGAVPFPPLLVTLTRSTPERSKLKLCMLCLLTGLLCLPGFCLFRLIQLHFPQISPSLNGGMCGELECVLVVESNTLRFALIIMTVRG